VPPLRQLADLPQWPASLLIAVLNGGYFGPQLQQLRDDPVLQRRFYPMVSNQDKVALLESGRVQAVLEEELAWFWRVKGQATVYRPLLLVHADPVYFGFSRVSVSPELLRRLDAAWLQLYQSGQLQQIRDYYLATPTADLAPGAAAGSAAEISRMPAPAPFL
jgi:ABC-type amino acid transport substrate-binding protein